MMLPPDLERYLPPDLWQQVAAGSERRGLLLNALERLRSIHYLLSTFLPSHLVQERMRDPVPGRVHGEWLDGSLLFSDVRGFTALAERLQVEAEARADQAEGHPSPLLDITSQLPAVPLPAVGTGRTGRTGGTGSGPSGAEQLTDLLNRYFEPMLECLAWSGGILLKFAGDALWAFFPTPHGPASCDPTPCGRDRRNRRDRHVSRAGTGDLGLGEHDRGEQARWAVRAGQRMLRTLGKLTGFDPPLQMKIGISTGSFLSASVGSAERMEYLFLGETVARAMAAEASAGAGQVVVDEATAARLSGEEYPLEAIGPGLWLFPQGGDGNLDEFEIRAETRRARGAIPWSASPEEMAGEIDLALRQIQALTPYLAPELVERIVTQAQQPAVGNRLVGEYRPTAVAFVNFSGPESLPSGGDDRQAERITRFLNEYFRAMHRVIARHGGVVSRIDPYKEGSKMLVLFGTPVAREDDRMRAVSAVLAMGQELTRLAQARWLKTPARDQHRSRRRLEATPFGPLPSAGMLRDRDASQPGVGGPAIEQRIGLTYGYTLAGQVGSSTRREYTVMGDEVNLAARLMAAAQPGQVLISQRVYDNVVDYYSAITLSPIHVKGKSQPVPIYQPITARDDPLARRLRKRGLLAGRDAELERGQEVVRQVLDGTGATLTICGPAGIGKSRLADELAAYALARGVRVLFHACRSYATDLPYGPWADLLQSTLGISPSTAPDARCARLLQSLSDMGLASGEYAEPLGALFALDDLETRQVMLSAAIPAPFAPEEGGSRPALFERLEQKVVARPEAKRDVWQLIPLATGGIVSTQKKPQTAKPGGMWEGLQTRIANRQQERLFRAVGELLARLSAGLPLLVLFDNAQWLDPASRQMCDYLADQLRDKPVLFLLVERSEPEIISNADLQSGPIVRDRSAVEIRLGPLSLESSRVLIGAILGESSTSADLVAMIHERSEGNLLMIEEVLRWLQRTVKGGAPPQRWLDALRLARRTSGGSAESASDMLSELVLSRLDSLPLRQREAAKAASVIGNEFGQGELAYLLPSLAGSDCEPSRLQGVEAQRADRPNRHGVLSGLEKARLVFLLEANREPRYAFCQTLVRQVVYEIQPFAQRRELHAALAAYLEAEHAGDLVTYAELLAHHYELAGQRLASARHLVLAGRRARQRYAHAQAATCYTRALSALEPLPGEESSCEAMTLQARAHEGRGDVALLMGDFTGALADYRLCRMALDGLAEDARRPPGLLVKLALVLAVHEPPALQVGGRASEAVKCARQAWEACRPAGPGDQGPRGQQAGSGPVEKEWCLAAAAALAWILWRAGDPHAAEWVDLGRQAVAYRTDPWSIGLAAMLSDLAGDRAEARRMYLVLDAAQVQGAHAGAVLTSCRLGDLRLGQGDLGGAMTYYDHAADLCARESDACGLALARYRQAEASLRRGDAISAQAALREAASLLATSAMATQEDRLTIDQMLSGTCDKVGVWPAWRWQAYDDAFRISILFRP
jgi:class 3 adenylate cyclase/tetratricopeptide (TPR) repeat protein